MTGGWEAWKEGCDGEKRERCGPGWLLLSEEKKQTTLCVSLNGQFKLVQAMKVCLCERESCLKTLTHTQASQMCSDTTHTHTWCDAWRPPPLLWDSTWWMQERDGMHQGFWSGIIRQRPGCWALNHTVYSCGLGAVFHAQTHLSFHHSSPQSSRPALRQSSFEGGTVNCYYHSCINV